MHNVELEIDFICKENHHKDFDDLEEFPPREFGITLDLSVLRGQILSHYKITLDSIKKKIHSHSWIL